MNAQKILVTGTTGFIGRNLIPKLVEKGHEVIALQRYVTGRYVQGTSYDIKTYYCDIRDANTLRLIIKEVQPDMIIHLAAISPVSYSFDRSQEVIETNFLGTINLAEACLSEIPDFKHFLFPSSAETYGNGINPKKENMILNPISPYAVSKVSCEKYLKYMYDAYSFPSTILRFFNTYGRSTNVHFVVERIITQMIKGSKVRLGDSEPIRDFLYMDDHLDSYITCLNKKPSCDIYNICTGRGVSIRDLTKILSELIGFKGQITWNTIPKRPLDIKVLYGNNNKAKKKLNWVPKYDLETGLDLTIQQFYKIYPKNKMM